MQPYKPKMSFLFLVYKRIIINNLIIMSEFFQIETETTDCFGINCFFEPEVYSYENYSEQTLNPDDFKEIFESINYFKSVEFIENDYKNEISEDLNVDTLIKHKLFKCSYEGCSK